MTIRTHLRSHAVRRRLATLALLPVIGLAAACGGGEEAADPSTGSDSSSESGSSESADTGGGDHYTAETIIPAMQEALGDQSSARVQMNMTGQLEMTMDGRMQMSEEFDEGEMEMTMDIGGQSLDLRLVDGLIYVSGPPATPKGKWLEVDPQDPNDPMGAQFAGITKSGDLNTTFDAFRAGLKKVEHVGAEEIDGEQTEHYVFTVDSTKAFKAQGQPPAPGAPKDLVYDVWLTQDDLMRRVSFELGPVKAVVDATEWGEPVDVAKPAAGDIVQAPAA